MVALNILTILRPENRESSPPFSRMNCKSSDRFQETILSAQSTTHQLSLCNDSWCFSINYFTLPGVPIRISQPLESSIDCSSNCLPPTATNELKFMPLVNFLNSSSICSASSLVGTRTSAYGPSSKLFILILSRGRRKWMMGKRYPRVLPSPVGAIAIKSLWIMPIGIDCICMGLGFTNPSFYKFCTKVQLAPSASFHSRMGQGALPPLIQISWSSLKMRQSLSSILSSGLDFQVQDGSFSSRSLGGWLFCWARMGLNPLQVSSFLSHSNSSWLLQ